MAERAERERPFWRSLVGALGWRQVADAGCGSGFHVALLRELGVETIGFDMALSVVMNGAGSVVGDLGQPPLRPGTFDAALCLGNTISLVTSREAQTRALASLASLVRPGGSVLVQGEDVGVLVADGPVARTRALEDGKWHVRVFERKGRRVQMLAGVTRPDSETPLEATLILPTTRRTLVRLARTVGLGPIGLPAAPPAGATTWWTAFSAPSTGS
jgi:SAM-dependent methyltransferase